MKFKKKAVILFGNFLRTQTGRQVCVCVCLCVYIELWPNIRAAVAFSCGWLPQEASFPTSLLDFPTSACCASSPRVEPAIS